MPLDWPLTRKKAKTDCIMEEMQMASGAAGGGGGLAVSVQTLN